MDVLAPNFDAMVVLGGGTHPSGELYPASLARTDAAVRFFGHGWTNHLIFSGAGEAEAMQQHAIDQGIDPGVTVTEPSSLSTIGNATSTIETITNPHGWFNLAVVTSRRH